MKVLILYFEPVIGHMLKEVLELEGYTVICTQNASEAIRAIEDSSDYYLLITDNLQVNPKVREALAVLRDRPELRQRVWIVGMAVFNNPAWVTDGLIDEHMPMPFTVEQLLRVVEAHVGLPPN